MLSMHTRAFSVKFLHGNAPHLAILVWSSYKGSIMYTLFGLPCVIRVFSLVKLNLQLGKARGTGAEFDALHTTRRRTPNNNK